MSNRNLVICDREEGYAEAFAVFLMKRKELAFQVQVCGGIAQVQALTRRRNAESLRRGRCFYLQAPERRRRMRAR